MKRNTTALRALTIGLLGVSAFALSACNEDDNAQSFKSVEECRSASHQVDAKFTEADCDKGYADAQAQYKESAPRYDAMKTCEEEHGAGNCTEEHRANGGSVFSPFMQGYMMGWLINGNNRSYNYTPMYPVYGGGYASAGGHYTSTLGSRSYATTGSFARAASTAHAAPMTHASVASRGGFGGAHSGSFGG